MPLHLNCSNRIESLQDQLARQLSETPLAHPFLRELILVPSIAIQRWLNLQLAAQHGVAANIDYQLPAAWFWQLAATAVTGGNAEEKLSDPLSRELAAWKIFGALPTLLHLPAFEPLAQYLHDDGNGVKRWQLARRIGDTFDRYQYYRPDWIRAWSAEGHAPRSLAQDIPQWQPLLWHELVQSCVGRHRVAVMDRLLALLHAGKLSAQLLPERICCFALSSLPPLFVEVLNALASRTEVHLYQHSPTDQYWADLRSKKTLARIRVDNPEEADYYDTGNELLASWGRQGQAFQDLLLSSDVVESAQWEHYPSPGTDTLLHRLQHAILALSDEAEVIAIDGSVQVNICHSALRECQVLHDQLLSDLEKMGDLKPEDILVIVPEISRYAPCIEATFRRDENGSRPFIPWNVSDTSVADEHPLIRTFFQLLALPGLRFTQSEFLSFLGVPEISRRFGLDDTAQEEVISLLEQSQVRWGLDGAHKMALGLPATEQNTWLHATDRLMAGYALGESEYWEGIAPVQGVSGARAVALGRCLQLLKVLTRWSAQLQYERSAEQWQIALNALLEELFDGSVDDDDKLQQIRDAISELKDFAGTQVLSTDLLRTWLTDSLGSRTVHNRFFSGGVTFCGMRPMRSVPFRMICVLGMNDLAFPRRENAVPFDAMSRQWRPGDPRKGDEDRYLLLETLLCARDKIYFSYTGRSLKDNSKCEPSVLLQELLDFLDVNYTPADSATKLISESISTVQPMQAFSARNFLRSDVAPSYDSWWCQVAQSLADSQPGLPESSSQETWTTVALPMLVDESDSIELSRLIRFLQHPVKYFCNVRLRIYLQEEASSEDDEVFSLDGLQSWSIRNEMIANLLQKDAEMEDGALQTLLSARGVLPHGALADSAFAQTSMQAQALLVELTPYRGQHPVPRRVELSFGSGEDVPLRLLGQVAGYLPGAGLLHYTPSSCKGKHLLAAWVEHLALCAMGSIEATEETALFCRDTQMHFVPVPAEEAHRQLAQYLQLYREGLTRPLPIFPDASFAFAQGTGDKALKAAFRCWTGDEFRNVPGDRDDAYVRLVMQSSAVDPLQESEWKVLAEAVYGAAVRHAAGHGASS